jgi:hypothetical protein
MLVGTTLWRTRTHVGQVLCILIALAQGAFTFEQSSEKSSNILVHHRGGRHEQ